MALQVELLRLCQLVAESSVRQNASVSAVVKDVVVGWIANRQCVIVGVQSDLPRRSIRCGRKTVSRPAHDIRARGATNVGDIGVHRIDSERDIVEALPAAEAAGARPGLRSGYAAVD